MASCRMGSKGLLPGGRELWECSTHGATVVQDAGEPAPESCYIGEQEAERKRRGGKKLGRFR